MIALPSACNRVHKFAVICEAESILTEHWVLPVLFTLINFFEFFRLGPLINHGPDLGFIQLQFSASAF